LRGGLNKKRYARLNFGWRLTITSPPIDNFALHIRRLCLVFVKREISANSRSEHGMRFINHPVARPKGPVGLIFDISSLFALEMYADNVFAGRAIHGCAKLKFPRALLHDIAAAFPARILAHGAQLAD
jgi:hypothetical protein